MSRRIIYYRHRGWISEVQARAGQRFASTLVAADRWMQTRDPADRPAAIQARDALRELGSLRSVAVDVCGRGFLASQWAKTNGMEPDAGIALLQSALSTLARFYGFQEAEREDAA